MIINKRKKNKEASLIEKKLIKVAIAFSILGFIIIIAAFLIFSFDSLNFITASVNTMRFANFGSFIAGTVGVIWSFVGVILFYLTLRLQRKDLLFQMDELILTRKEIEGQRKQMEIQNSTLKIQNFENTFFQLLNTYNEIAASININIENQNLKGRKCFFELYKKLKEVIQEQKQDKIKPVEELNEITTIEGSKIFFATYQSELGHYFRFLYQLIKFIDTSAIEDKTTYISLLRAQLSSYELTLLFYNCLSEKEKFKLFLEKYSLLKNLDKSKIFNKEHLNLYKTEAYIS
ncbi:MAG: putative phage abortive infection protein [Bacteroidetes bacterium]|nr:putative phage abortive infection protein [Bacteroidota bacterium]